MTERRHAHHITAAGEVREITYRVRHWSDDTMHYAVAEDFRDMHGNEFPLEPGDRIEILHAVPPGTTHVEATFNLATDEQVEMHVEDVTPRSRRWWRRDR